MVKEMFSSKSHPKNIQKKGSGRRQFLVLFVLFLQLALTAAAFFFLIEDTAGKNPPYVLPGLALAAILFLILALKWLLPLIPSFQSDNSGSKEKIREELEKIIQSTPSPVIVTDSSGKALVVNKSFKDLFGLGSLENYCMLNDERFSSWELKDIFSRVLLGESVSLPETWCRLYRSDAGHSNGRVCLRRSFIPVRDGSGRVEKVYVKIEDCTESTKREEKIKKERIRLRAALEGARQVVCEMHPDTGRMVVDLKKTDGEFAEELDTGNMTDFENLVHPEDREHLLQHIKDQASRQGEHFKHRFRLLSGTRDWAWIQFQGKAFSLNGNDCTQLVGTMVDITGEYENEQRLKDSESRYRSIFANAVDGMYLVCTDDSVICVNQAFADILGYDSPDEFEKGDKAKNFSRIYYIPRIRETRQAALLEKGEILQLETQAMRKDGTLIWISENARALRDEQGKILYFEGSLTDITTRKKNEERLLHQALFDHRTNLPNRSFFIETLEKSLKKAAEDKNFFFGLLFFDLDGFGVVNDSYGHLMGDRLLLEVSQKLRDHLPADDTLARFSSDEFCVMAVGRGHAEIKEKAEGLREMLEEAFVIDGHEISITASIGVLLYNMNYTRGEDMLRDAEMSMLQAKKGGKNRCVVFSSEMYEQKSKRTLMEKDLRRAMDRDELSINYQPIVRLDNSRLKGLEALIRWTHPEHGMISPAKFIPLAEETGLIEPIGDWILLESCRQIRNWHKFDDSLILNVNLSGKQLEKAGLEGKLYQVLQKAGLDPGRLNLEVTESMAMSRMDYNVRTLKRLKYMGLRLSIDDFGTGYSSLAHLQRFPLDELKIDRSFINTMGLNKNNFRIVQAIVDLGLGLELELVAEGIETEAQLNQVKDFKCHYGQGYLFSRPLAPLDVEKIWLVPDKQIDLETKQPQIKQFRIQAAS